MGRGTQFGDLVTMFKEEIGISLDGSVADAVEPSIKRLISRTQERLLDVYDWGFMKDYFDKDTVAGQRYYDFPPANTAPSGPNLQPEGVLGVNYKWNGLWIPVAQGIDLDDYSQYDSDNNVRLDPIMKWKIHGESQFEVWPLPSIAGTIRFYGTKTVAPLTNNADTAVLDDMLLVLFAAGEWLSRDPKKEALMKVKMGHAQSRLANLRGQLSTGKIVPLTGGASPTKGKKIIVAYAR